MIKALLGWGTTTGFGAGALLQPPSRGKNDRVRREARRRIGFSKRLIKVSSW
ncbi:hypothetical protein VAWG004_14630 [Aeromonas veronii]|nr:hypothetical protein VAWG004_14630 [Aeromonas veronii]